MAVAGTKGIEASIRDWLQKTSFVLNSSRQFRLHQMRSVLLAMHKDKVDFDHVLGWISCCH
jgi:hypothetical protein